MNRLVSIITALTLLVGPSHGHIASLRAFTKEPSAIIGMNPSGDSELTPPSMELQAEQRRLPAEIQDLLDLTLCTSAFGPGAPVTMSIFLHDLVQAIMAGHGDIDDSCDVMKTIVLPYLKNCVAETTGIEHTIYVGWVRDGAYIYKYTSVKGVFIDHTGRVGCFDTSCHGGGFNLGFNTGAVAGILLGDAENDFPGKAWGAELGGEVLYGLDLAGGFTVGGKPYAEISAGFGAGFTAGINTCTTDTFGVATLADPLSSDQDDVPEGFKLVVAHWEGGASDCPTLGCTTESGLTACKNKCEDDPRCNLFNFCPSGATCVSEWGSPVNRCCLRECGPAESYESWFGGYDLVTKWGGWDVYVPVTACYNDHAWRSSAGKSCADYYELSLCENGGYGPGWSPSWGEFANFANATGVDASHACCGCKPRFNVVEVTSGTCEGHGYVSIYDLERCSEAAQARNYVINWGPYGGYEDVVDGCSVRSDTQLFMNLPNECTRGSCECSGAQPCLCDTVLASGNSWVGATVELPQTFSFFSTHVQPPTLGQGPDNVGCSELTTHSQCKPAPGCLWQHDTKECLNYEDVPCNKHKWKPACDKNDACGWYGKEKKCMSKDDLPCDDNTTKWNCKKAEPKCAWNTETEECMQEAGR